MPWFWQTGSHCLHFATFLLKCAFCLVKDLIYINTSWSPLYFWPHVTHKEKQSENVKPFTSWSDFHFHSCMGKKRGRELHTFLYELYLLRVDTGQKIQKWNVFPQYANAVENINCNIFKESFIFQSFYCFVDGNVVWMAWHPIRVKS